MSTRKEESKTPRGEIVELIQLIDDNSKDGGRPLFQNRDFLGGWIYVIAGLFSLMFLDYLTFSLKLIPYGEYIGGLLTDLAIIVAILSLVVQLADRQTLNTRFRRALRLRTSFTEDQKLILRALIKMRSKHSDFALKGVYDKNKEMFTKEKLMEILYA